MLANLLGNSVLYRTTAADRATTLEDQGAVLAAVIVAEDVDGVADLQVFLRRAPGTALVTGVPRSNTTENGTWWPK